MHYYWFPILASILIHYIKTGKGEDMQSHTIEDPNKQEQTKKKDEWELVCLRILFTYL